MTQSPSLPELPKPASFWHYQDATGTQLAEPSPIFSADQINAHGLACYEAGSAAAAQAAKWRSLCDSEWVNIVNNPKVLFASDKEEAVAEAFKLIEAKLRELNDAAPTQGAEGAAPQAVVGEASEQSQALNNLHSTLKQALRIPGLPFPDPHAHSLDAYARAVHSAYCQLRFKIMDSIKLVESAMTVPAALTPSPTPTAPQEADELLLAAEQVVRADNDQALTTRMIRELDFECKTARAALAQHQPQQGEK